MVFNYNKVLFFNKAVFALRKIIKTATIIKSSSVLVFLLILTSCQSTNTENTCEKRDMAYYQSRFSSNYDHIKHIRNKAGKFDELEPPYFVDHVIEKLLEKPAYKKYITDRSLLRKLKNSTCMEDYVSIKDTLLNGDKCEIRIKGQTFDPNQHELTYKEVIHYENTTNYLFGIDGKYPKGISNTKPPKKELKSLIIEINDEKLDTKLEAYQNLYEPQFCYFISYKKNIEAYEDGENIYIYIFGGGNASFYFAKLIFDQSGFVTSIVADYNSLQDYGSVNELFIGF